MKKILFVFLVLCQIVFISCRQNKNTEHSEQLSSSEVDSVKPTFTVEDRDGIRFVHNTGSQWGDEPQVNLELIQTIGGPESSDSNLTFYKPTDIALDRDGNLYVADSGNCRIQKISPAGNLLGSYGKKGQGPGEFQFMDGLAVASDGTIYVSDKATKATKKLTPEGKEIQSLPPGMMSGQILLFWNGNMAFMDMSSSSQALVQTFDSNANPLWGGGEKELHDDFDKNRYFNRIFFSGDLNDNVYIAYATRNKIEKYTSAGKLELVIDRPLNYSISDEIRYEKKQFGPRNIDIPFVNFVSASIALDDKQRMWVLSYDRQLKFEEMGLTMHFSDGDGRYEGSNTLKTSEDAEIDAFVFHVFDAEGHLLGEVPINHHGGVVRIYNDRLYLLEPRHLMCVYVYHIRQL